jgi:hypothetical protein
MKLTVTKGPAMPRVRDTYPDRFMKAHHLEEMDQDAEHYVFTIQSSGETVFSDGKKQIILRFSETRLELGLNKGNAEMCEELFDSDDSDDWIGRKLALHVEVVKNTMAPGGKSPAIRVSSKATKLANKPPSKKPAPPVTQEEADGDEIPDDLPF